MDKMIHYLSDNSITDKKVLLRVDFNVTLDPNHKIADDARIRQSLPTINQLLRNNNKLILISHLGRPKGKDKQYSLQVVADKLQEYLPGYKITLVDDFTQGDKTVFQNQNSKEILILENIRFYPEEKQNDTKFAQRLASLADVFVNDAFGVCHRSDASVVGIPQLLPSFVGLLLEKEIEMISKAVANPKKPLVTIVGGAKISTKINLLGKLINLADYLLVGGGLANALLFARGINIGKSFCEYEEVDNAKKILESANHNGKILVLPSDVVVGKAEDNITSGQVKKITEIGKEDCILDIGPETQAKFGSIINKARTLVWNGPLGYIENPVYSRGSDFVYYAITQNSEVTSIVGGGDTLAAISKKEYLDKITHISTGGGAMLEFIEKGTLPGIEALKI